LSCFQNLLLKWCYFTKSKCASDNYFFWVSLYVILHELAEGSSKCFKFHYLVSQSILLDMYFLFLPKKFFVSICGVLIFFVPNRGFTLENLNWPIVYVFVARFLRSLTFFKGNVLSVYIVYFCFLWFFKFLRSSKIVS
jgi:hypothetical protein